MMQVRAHEHNEQKGTLTRVHVGVCRADPRRTLAKNVHLEQTMCGLEYHPMWGSNPRPQD